MTPEEAAKARSKEIHHRVMIGMGMFTAACGLAGGWVYLSGPGDLPALMYGRLTRPAPPAVSPVRKASSPVVVWREWTPELLRQARRQDRLLLLNLTASWPRGAHVMDETTYADPAAAAWLAERVLAVRVDGDARPDLAARYLSGGWPTTALLLPSGEVLDAATVMDAPRFLAWARALESSFRARRGGVMDAASAAAERRRQPIENRVSARPPQAALREQWDESTWGFGRPRFPRFERIAALRELGAPWAEELADKAVGGALALEDRVWGGFHRYAAGPGWEGLQYEKRLEDQAAALRAGLPGEAAERTLGYVRAFLQDPAGGYYASQSCEVPRPDGHVLEGTLYFGLDDARRRAFGLAPVDKRLFAADNGLMIRAVLEHGGDKAFALKTLERFWREGLEGGLFRRELAGGPRGLLRDQVTMGEAALSAGQRERARALAERLHKTLVDPATGALFDRPAAGELPEGLDRLLVPEWNLEALRFYRRLGPAFAPRASALAAWLSARPEMLDPAVWAAAVL